MIFKVSILIPCFNAEKWIAESIKSALDQRYENREVIVVDDGSQDTSLDIIKSFGPKIRWETGPNKGPNAARNRLLELSQGEWLQYLDADDYLLPEKIDNQIEFLTTNPQADIIYSPVFLEAGLRRRLIKIVDDKDFISNFLNWECIQTGGLFFRKSAVKEVGRWCENQPCCQEHELLLRLIKANKKFLFCNKTGSVYRYWNPLSVGRGNLKLIMLEIIKILDDLESYLKAANSWKPVYGEITLRKKFECARKLYGEFPELAKDIIERIRAESRKFLPRGPAAPFMYRTCYRIFGFSGTEKVAGFIRQLK